MKEQITIYYIKDKLHPDDYIVKRVLIQEGEYFKVVTYYNMNGKIKEFPSKLKFNAETLARYILESMKAPFFEKIEYQSVLEGI